MSRRQWLAGALVAVGIGPLVTATSMPGARADGTDDGPGDGAVVVHAFPTLSLAGGDTVKVWASGLPPSVPVRVVQCDTFGNPDEVCPDAAVVTTSRHGTLATRVTLRDPVISAEPAGSGRAVYCRADQCRIGLVTVPDQNGEEQVLGISRALRFTGSPATVAVTPSTDLRTFQWVRVTGTAHGAQGRAVRIVQQSCYDLVQDTGCYAAAPAVWTRVRLDGTFSTRYLARRFLSEGDTSIDCNDRFDILGECVVSATVHRRDGEPDDSFGKASWGQPMARLDFLGPVP